MLQVSDKAREELISFFKGKDMTPVRVYLAPGG